MASGEHVRTAENYGYADCLSANLPTQPVLRSLAQANFLVIFDGCSREAVHLGPGVERGIRSLKAWDRIYVTTLFSFEYPKIAQTIDFAHRVANGQADKVFVGGIAASLMHSRFLQERRWQGVRFVKGLLSGAPATALQLDEFSEELYAEDLYGRPIEDLVPEYGILDKIDYKYAVRDAYFAYTSRGCIRKCHFCGVPKLEGAQRDTESLTELVMAIDDLYGPKKDLVLMDNNVVASPRFKEIMAEIRDLGDRHHQPRLRRMAQRLR